MANPVSEDVVPHAGSSTAAAQASTLRRRATSIGACLLPWSWYGVRDGHPLLDWAAILMPALVGAAVAVLVMVAMAARSMTWLRVALTWVVFGAFVIVAPWSPADHGQPSAGIRIAAANVLAGNPEAQAVTDDMLTLTADVLVVSELFGADQTIAAQLDERYPYAFRTSTKTGVGVWSRFPLHGESLTEDGMLAASRGARVQVDAPSGRFILYALHLYRPSRDALGPEVTLERQRALVEELDALAAAEDLPAVLAGDLNTTDRGSAYRRLAAGRADAMRSSWAAPTSFRLRNRPLLLRIDHVLIPQGWCADAASRGQLSGSDHDAVVATVGPCRRPRQAGSS